MNNNKEKYERHKQAVVLAITAAALLSFVIPLDHLYGTAEAAQHSALKDKRPGSESSVSISQGALLSNGEGVATTSSNFVQQSQQICSGIASCPNTNEIRIPPPTPPPTTTPTPPPENCNVGGGGPPGCPPPHVCSMFPETPGCKGEPPPS